MRGWTTFISGLPEYKQQMLSRLDAKHTALMPRRERNNNAEFSVFDVVEVEAGVREKHEDRSATASALPPATPSAGAALTPVNKLWVTLTPHVLKVIIIVLLVAIVIGLVAVLTLVGINISMIFARPNVTELPESTTFVITTPIESSSAVITKETSPLPTSSTSSALPSSTTANYSTSESTVTTEGNTTVTTSSTTTATSTSTITPTTTTTTTTPTTTSTTTTSTTTSTTTTTPTTTTSTTTSTTTTTPTTTTSTTTSTTTTTPTTASTATTPTITTSTTTTSSTTTTPTTTSPTTTSTTTTTPVTTTTLADCNEFRCGSGECVAMRYLCDGFPDCKDGSDEGIGCVCGNGQWRCNSGQCINATAKCDQHYDCMDKSDEYSCEDCSGFQCDNGICLWDGYRGRCDQVFDCSDLSDEMECPPKFGTIKCKNNVQILQQQWCDGIDHCGDNSDETNCKCNRAKRPCADGTCITRAWFCDGFPDCVDGSDEHNCSKCEANQFQCLNSKCLDPSAVCNGYEDCLTGEDEQNCFSVKQGGSKELLVIYAGQEYAVCSDVWSTGIAEQVCNNIGQQHMSDWQEIKPTESWRLFVALKNSAEGAVTSNLEIRKSCFSGQVISISCQKQECGERQVSFLQSFVLGGQIAAPGKWPWMASLLYLGKMLCGATLIHPQWLLTAAHCITSAVSRNYDLTKAPFYFDVILGSVHKLGQSPDGTPYRIRVSKILLSPHVNVSDYGTVDWDMALIKLSVAVNLSSYIQPVCLPHALQETPVGLICYLAGWGITNDQQVAVSPEFLRDTRLRIWEDGACANNTIPPESPINLKSTFCASGIPAAVPSGCQGDSGGPLMCFSSGHRWVVAGIMSQGSTTCGAYSRFYRANRFARVSTSVNWIRQQVGEL